MIFFHVLYKKPSSDIMSNVIWRRQRCFKASLVPTQIWAPEMIERKRDLSQRPKRRQNGLHQTANYYLRFGPPHRRTTRYYIIFYAGNGGQRFFLMRPSFIVLKFPARPSAPTSSTQNPTTFDQRFVSRTNHPSTTKILKLYKTDVAKFSWTHSSITSRVFLFKHWFFSKQLRGVCDA